MCTCVIYDSGACPDVYDVCAHACVWVQRPEEDVGDLLYFSPLYSLRIGSLPEPGTTPLPPPHHLTVLQGHSHTWHVAWTLWI